MRKNSILKSAVVLASASLVGVAANAAAITPGDLVIYRVGDGSAALSATAAPVFLDEYTTAGSLVQSIAVSSSGGTAMTAAGSATTEGIVSRSQDGNSLVFGGYRANTGTATVANTVNKVIGTVNLAGVVNTSASFTAGTATMRSATTIDGTSFWASLSTDVRYQPNPASAATTVIDVRNSRQVNFAGNVLYASNGSTTITGKVQTYGTLPTTATAATPAVTLATTDAVNGFVLLDLDAGVAGVDTMYINSTVESRLRKYSLVGGSWTLNGFISSATQNLTAITNGSNVDLYLTTATTLQKLSDTTGYNGALGTSAPTTLVTAGANMGFRGIGTLLAAPAVSSIALSLTATGTNRGNVAPVGINGGYVAGNLDLSPDAADGNVGVLGLSNLANDGSIIALLDVEGTQVNKDALLAVLLANQGSAYSIVPWVPGSNAALDAFGSDYEYMVTFADPNAASPLAINFNFAPNSILLDQIAVVPEPTTLGMIGLCSLGLLRRRRVA